MYHLIKEQYQEFCLSLTTNTRTLPILTLQLHQNIFRCQYGLSPRFYSGDGVSPFARTQTHIIRHKHTHIHTYFVLGLAPLLARQRYGSTTNEGHHGCDNNLSPLADSTKSSFLPRSCDSRESIISQESQKHRHTLIKYDSGCG